jgi:hypothetical protein
MRCSVLLPRRGVSLFLEDAVISRLDTAAHPHFRRVAALAETAMKSPAVMQSITGTDAALMKMYFDSSLIRCARDFLKQSFGDNVNATGPDEEPGVA